MYWKIVRSSKLKKYNHHKLLISSAIAMGILYPPNLISQTFINSKLDEINKYSKKSFITEAIEKTGSSVVTIETQKFLKKKTIFKKFSTISRSIF